MRYLLLFDVGMPKKFKFQHRKEKERKKRMNTSKSNGLTTSPSTPSHSAPSTSLPTPIHATPSTQPTPIHATPPTSSHTVSPIEQPPSMCQFLSAVAVPSGWAHLSSNDRHSFCKLSPLSGTSTTPVITSHTITIYEDCTWSVHVFSSKLNVIICAALSHFPVHMSLENIPNLITTLDRLPICCGQPDLHFVEMLKARKGKIVSNRGNETVAYVDACPVKLNGTNYLETVRSSNCQFIGNFAKCDACRGYRTNLRTMYNRWQKKKAVDVSSASSHTNERYLNTPGKKAKLSKLRNKARAAKEEVKKLRKKIKEMNEKCGEIVDPELHTDLFDIMRSKQEQINKAYPENSFARLFWEEQLKAASVTDTRNMRWHPTMIKWCLNMMLISSSSYDAMRNSGFLKLPSKRTLQDYTNYFENKPGFQDEVDQQLLQEVSSLKLSESRNFFSIVLDEMKIKEGLVYNKVSGKVIGFTELGDINNDLSQLEQG